MNRNTLYFSGAVGVAQLFSFLTLFAYTSNLKPEIYALIAILETIILLLQSCIGGSIDRGTQRFLVDKNPEVVISTSVSISMALSFILFPVISICFSLFSRYTLLEFSIMYVAAFGYILHAIILVKYQFSERPKFYFYASIAKTFSFFVFSLLFLYAFNMEEESFLYSSLLTGLILIAVTFWVAKPQYRYLKDLNFVKDMLTYSLPFVPTLLASWCIIWSSRLFMTGHIEDQDIGVFSAAQRVAMVFFIFTQAVTLVATPTLFRLLSEDKKNEASDCMLLNVNVLMIVALSISFFFPDLLFMFMGEDYEGMQFYISILMYVNFLSAIMGVSTSILFNFYKKTALQMKIFLLISFLAFVLNAILIPKFGMEGVVVSLFLPMILLLVVHFYFVNNFIQFPKLNRSVVLASILFSLLLLVDYIFVINGASKTFMLSYQFFVIFSLLAVVFENKLRKLLQK